MQYIPCFYHPISVLFLDDNSNFLSTLELELSNQLNMICCTDPHIALSLIYQAQENVNEIVFKKLDNNEADATTDCLVNFEISQLHKLIYDQSRFNYLAILVIDYKMPKMNGIEFCHNIHNKHLYKLMLTAEADKDTAIQAFNDGLIDKFLFKKNKNLCEELLNNVEQLKQRYFNKLSSLLLETLGKEFKALLSDTQFQVIFSDIQKNNKIVEYYLVDSYGSFLLLDEKAKPTWLIIRSEKDMNECISTLEGLAAPAELVDQLKCKKKLLFMFSEEDYKRPIHQWPSLLLDAQKLNDNYYYSIFNGQLTNTINWKKVENYR